MWTRKNYEDAAQKIGEQFVESGGTDSINDMSIKLARDAALNPDGIRTVVRLANVAAFEKFFEKRAANNSEDRMIEFAVGDPEVVISALGDEVADAHQEKVAAAYDKASDYYADISYGVESEKVAQTTEVRENDPGASTPGRVVSSSELRLLFKQAEEKMLERQKTARYNWMSRLKEAAARLVAEDSRISARTAFEKDAASEAGEGILPELRMLQTLTSPATHKLQLFGGEKTAEVLSTHISVLSPRYLPILNLVKEAMEARKDSGRMDKALAYFKEQQERIL